MKTKLRLMVYGMMAAAFLGAPMTGLTAEAKKSAKPYTLKTCLVSGEKLGEMGDPYVFTYQGREIKLCCKGCKKDFDKEPAKFIKKLEAAEKGAK